MLARIAEGLYWMGRYIKRSEHLARYLRIQYFTTLDVNMYQNKDFALRSIMNMAGIDYKYDEAINEEEVLMKVGFDQNTSSSIFSTIKNARENARSNKHVFSNEIWESINKLYLFVRDYNVNSYKTRTLYDFTVKIEDHVKIIQSNIYSTLIKNDEYHFINAGLYFENTVQIVRILRTKIIDTEILSQNGENKPVRQHQWHTTLKALESLDMHNKIYKHKMSLCTISEFLITNPIFPRSIYLNLRSLLKSIKHISVVPEGFSELEYHLSKLESVAKFYRCENMTFLNEYLNNMSADLNEIHDICDKIYFKFHQRSTLVQTQTL